MAPLRDLRKAAGLTQMALAERAGLSVATVSRAERSPLFVEHIRTRTRIARALDVQVEDIDEFSHSSATEPCVIYAILDPVSGRPRYVGQTVRATGERLEQHLRDCQRASKKSHIHGWLKSVLDSGDIPAVSVLEITTVEHATERELWWMNHLRQRGKDLLNTAKFQRPANWAERQAKWDAAKAKREEEGRQHRERREANPELYKWRASGKKRLPRIPELYPGEILDYREKHNLSQKQLAEHLGYSNSAISLWESGKRPPPPGIKTLLHQLGIKLHREKLSG